MKKYTPVTSIIKKGKAAPCTAEPIDGSLALGSGFAVNLKDHAYIELFVGDDCDVTIENCADVSVYCDNNCRITITAYDDCDMEIFAENDCSITLNGSVRESGRIVCGNNCSISCWGNVEIESGAGCKIHCADNCNNAECGCA